MVRLGETAIKPVAESAQAVRDSLEKGEIIYG